MNSVLIPRWIYRDCSWAINNAQRNGMASCYNTREKPCYGNYDEAGVHHDGSARRGARLGACALSLTTWWIILGQKMHVRRAKSTTNGPSPMGQHYAPGTIS